MKKQILIILLISFTALLYSQTQSKTIINANLNLSGLHCDNKPPLGPCGITTTNKSTSNTQISFNKDNNELTFVFSKTTLDITNKSKLLNNELEKGFYLYTFDEDFILSKELKEALNITILTKIKQGSYLVKVIKDEIIMKLKLE